MPAILRIRAAAALAAFSLLLPPAFAGKPANYYNTADPTNATTLRNSLNDIVTSGHSFALTYPSTNFTNAIRRVDEDYGDANRLRLIYGPNATRLKSASGGVGNGDATTGDFSLEHLFPRSLYNDESPMKDDIHAVIPADADINSARSNEPFDNIGSPTYTDAYGNASTGGGAGLFEPADLQKGDAARAILYMDIRYAGESTEPDLVLTNSYPAIDSDTMAYLTTMLQWHNDDPPDAHEVIRNDRVYDEQGNANPFIDHPEWVPIIYSSASPSVANGDTISPAFTDLASSSVDQGEVNVPFIRLALTLGANQYDLGQIDVQRLGSISDSDVELRLYYDADSSDSLTAGDMLLDAETPVAGAATLIPYAPLRLLPGTARVILTASIANSATLGSTIQLRVAANGLHHNARGGADTDPTTSAFTSTSATVAAGAGWSTLIVSEVFEGTLGNLKYVEIWNPSAFTIDLEDAAHDVVLQRYTNNGGTVSATIDLAGSIPPGDFFVVVNNFTEFDAVFPPANRDQQDSNINHNGNDKYVLYDSTTATTIDAFASDLIGNATDHALNVVAFRKYAALPNDGDWGTAATPLDNNDSSSGFWRVLTVTGGNANALSIGTPGGFGGAGGVEVPLEISAFSIE